MLSLIKSAGSDEQVTTFLRCRAVGRAKVDL